MTEQTPYPGRTKITRHQTIQSIRLGIFAGFIWMGIWFLLGLILWLDSWSLGGGAFLLGLGGLVFFGRSALPWYIWWQVSQKGEVCRVQIIDAWVEVSYSLRERRTTTHYFYFIAYRFTVAGKGGLEQHFYKAQGVTEEQYEQLANRKSTKAKVILSDPHKSWLLLDES